MFRSKKVPEHAQTGPTIADIIASQKEAAKQLMGSPEPVETLDTFGKADKMLTTALTALTGRRKWLEDEIGKLSAELYQVNVTLDALSHSHEVIVNHTVPSSSAPASFACDPASPDFRHNVEYSGRGMSEADIKSLEALERVLEREAVEAVKDEPAPTVIGEPVEPAKATSLLREATAAPSPEDAPFLPRGNFKPRSFA